MGNWESVLKAFYLEKRTIASISEEFDLGVDRALYRLFPLYHYSDVQCEACGGGVVARFINRTNRTSGQSLYFDLYQRTPERNQPPVHFYRQPRYRIESCGSARTTPEGYLVSTPYCSECDHQPLPTCECETCLKMRNRNRQLAAEKIASQTLEQIPPAKELDSLTVSEIFFTLFALSINSNQCGNYIFLDDLEPEELRRILQTGLFVTDVDMVADSIRMVSIYEFHIETELPYRLAKDLSQDVLTQSLKELAGQSVLNADRNMEIRDLWAYLALDEALGVLNHYLNVFNLRGHAGDQTISAIRKGLRKYGLAQTARFIYNAVKRAHVRGLEQGYTPGRAFSLVCGNINFWLDDFRARAYNAPPFFRKEPVLGEPLKVTVFAHSFLELHGIDYFTDCIAAEAFPSVTLNLPT